MDGENKKISFLIIVLFVVLSLTFGCINSNNTSQDEKKQYVSGAFNDSGIYFSLPEGWQAIKENTSEYLAQAWNKDGTLRLHVYKYDNKTAANYIDTEVAYYKNWGDNNPTTLSDTVNGQNYQVVSGYNNVEKTGEKSYVFQKGKSVYVLKFTDTFFDALDEDKMQEIAMSFKVI